MGWMQVGSGGMSGLVIDDSQTLRLANLESEVVGGACGVTTTRCAIARNIAQFPSTSRRKP